MSDQILWFAARGAGVVSLLLFTGVTALGVATVTRWQRPGWPRFLTAELHRTISLLSLVFLGVHVATAVLDPYASLGLAAALVPLASAYRPIPVALGVIAIDLFVALVVTSLLRQRIGLRAWRAIHWLAYGAWPLALSHGILAGTDAAAPWMLAVDVACIATVVLALGWRVYAGPPNRARLAEIAGSSSFAGEPRRTVR